MFRSRLLPVSLFALILVHIGGAALFCSDWANRVSDQHRFHALAHCRRSNGTQVGLANFRRVERCAQLAHKRRALAFNYAPPRRASQRNKYEKVNVNPNNYTIVASPRVSATLEESFNCEVLACPEWSDFGKMINDTRFDYYSMYANPPPPPNATCLPGIGVFMYFNRFDNYSAAASLCRQPHSLGGAAGELATVMSARRTNAVAQLVRDQRPFDRRLDLAYVGLNQTAGDTDVASMRTAASEPIGCFLFRAWAPGHPRLRAHPAQPRCVAVTAQRQWRAYACSKRLPFVCEVFTSRPSRRLRLTQRCRGLPVH